MFTCGQQLGASHLPLSGAHAATGVTQHSPGGNGRPEGAATLSGLPPSDGVPAAAPPARSGTAPSHPSKQPWAGAHLPDLALQAVQRGRQNQLHQLGRVLLVGADVGQHRHRVRLAPPAGRAAQRSCFSAPPACCCWVHAAAGCQQQQGVGEGSAWAPRQHRWLCCWAPRPAGATLGMLLVVGGQGQHCCWLPMLGLALPCMHGQ